MTKRIICATLALWLIGCLPVAPLHPVQPPAVPVGGVGITLIPPMDGVTFHVGPISCTPDGAGIAFCIPVPVGEYVLTVDGVDPAIWEPADGNDQITVKPVGGGNVEVVARFKRIRPLTPTRAFRGRIHVEDKQFKDDQGQPWTWGFATEFLLLSDLLQGRDITPILDDPERGLLAVGANGVRVIGMAHYIPLNERQEPDFTPARYGDAYFEKLGQLADLLQIRGLYLEFTALADAQMLMPDPAAQRAFIQRVSAVLSTHANAFLEHCNEPFKNGCGDELAMGRAPGAVLQASGNYEIPVVDGVYRLAAVFDYVTHHPARGDEWPRYAHDVQDIRDGWGCQPGEDNCWPFAGAKVPVVADEPIGAADNAVSGRRASDPNLFREFGAACAMFGAGCTFHSDAGVATKPLTDRQLADARAFYAGMAVIPSVAQTWGYTRGPGAGVPLPIALLHFDEWALRTFGKVSGGSQYVVVIRPSAAWRFQEQNGYHCTALVPEQDVFSCSR